MRKQGRESGSWGLRTAVDGWHTVCFEEGIGYLEKDGEIVKDKKTGVAIRRMMAIPLDVQRVSFRVINVFDGHITAPLSVVLNVALYIFA